ncbi:MAG: TIGR03000 domain-containing protein [Gemmatales bacterium]
MLRSLFASAISLVCLCTGLAQPPKAATPRQLPDTPAVQSSKDETKSVPALIKVKVPENAVIWFENQKMNQTGTVRMFQSPVLELKKTYYYKVKVSWPTGGGTTSKDFTSEQEVAVKAGETTSIDFTPLVAHTREAKPNTTRDLIRQAAHATPAPDRANRSTNKILKE